MSRLTVLLERWATLALRRRWLAGLLAAALLAAAAAALPRLGFDNTPDAFFLDGDPTLQLYQRFKTLFGSDEYSLILLRAPESWSAGAFQPLRELGRAVAALPDVLDVTHLANVRHIDGAGGELRVGDFLPPDLPETEWAARRQAALAHPYYRGLYISADGRHLAMVVKTRIRPGEIQYKLELGDRIRALLAEPRFAALQGIAVGAPILDADVRRIVSQESALFGALVFLLVTAGFAWAFASVRGVALALGAALGGVLAAFGFMALRGYPAGLLTPIVPSFLISVGVGAAVFLVTALQQAMARGADGATAVRYALSEAGPAAVLATGTTAAALFAFSSSRIAPVQQVGLTMGVGLVAALLLTLLLFPAVFGRLPAQPRQGHAQRVARRLRPLQALGARVGARPGRTLAVALLLIAVAAAGMSALHGDYHYLGNFKADTPIRRDYERVDGVLPVSASIEWLLERRDGDFKDPEALRFAAALQAHLARYTGLPVKAYSLVDVLREINQALYDGDPAAHRLPDTRQAVAQYLLLYESAGGAELDERVSADGRVLRLTTLLPNRPDSAYRPLLAAAAAWLAAHRDHAERLGIEVRATGLVPLWLKISDHLTRSQAWSVALAMLVITAVLCLLFRSLPAGVLLAGVNLCVVGAALGIMGWFGIPLDPYTILVSAIALGILDDDTLHFVERIRAGLRDGRSAAEAVRGAYAEAGLAMFYTSAVLILAFSVYVFSTVASLTKFGLLTAMTLGVGLLVEYTVTPALVLLLERAGCWRRAAPARPGAALRVEP